MRPDLRFHRQSKVFWANVRTISEAVGYTERRTKRIRKPTPADIRRSYAERGLGTQHLFDDGSLTSLGEDILEYFEYRANVLNEYVRPRLMDVGQAKSEFERMLTALAPMCPIPNNKQKNEKRAPAYLTGIVNMIIESNSDGIPCDYDPRRLTTITKNGVPLRTLSRRVDGAFPSVVDPIAVWEIKEYYYTTTFGSRVADGVYETLLDGMELQELRESESVDVNHYLMVDSYFTWWECGRSYLCRMVDMIHMGYVDEVLFGYEVVERLPQLVRDWVHELGQRSRCR